MSPGRGNEEALSLGQGLSARPVRRDCRGKAGLAGCGGNGDWRDRNRVSVTVDASGNGGNLAFAPAALVVDAWAEVR